jgi:NAD(P)-dependent dehydrogenase (short-subunit alcohol dehydrogenase family)
MRLANKMTVITGGNSGIGLATARLFAAEGARVAIIGRNAKTLNGAATALGAGVLAVRADVTDGDETKQAMVEIADKLGGFDVLFANAGIDKESPLGETTLADFEEIVRTNLTAVFFTIQAALPHLKDGASIILSGSVQAVLGIPRRSAYAATKGGVRAMGRNLASELAPRRIRVNQVTPGATRTPLWSPFAPTEDAISALEQQTAGAVPLGRMGDAEEVAKAALYLASDDASYMTGAEIVLDGGATSAPLGAPIYRAAGW